MKRYWEALVYWWHFASPNEKGDAAVAFVVLAIALVFGAKSVL